MDDPLASAAIPYPARTLASHIENSLTDLAQHITNAVTEGAERKLQWIEYSTRGFRGIGRFKTAIHSRFGAVNPR